MVTQGRRVGVFGGTFDPPHLGHLVVAEQVRDRLGLDEVRFVVANEPWQKEGSRAITPAVDRLAMTRAAVGESEGLTVSAVELDIGGPSYTIDTLATLSKEEPGTEWHVIVGSDAAAGLNSWHESELLRQTVKIVEVNRPTSGPAGKGLVRAVGGQQVQSNVPQGWDSLQVVVPAIDISSTFIREEVERGASVNFLTTDSVVAYIEDLGLYREAP